MYASYPKVPDLVAQLKPFTGNTLSAIISHDNVYTVLSYNTPILWIDVETGDWRFDNRKYSVTTSKQQTYVRRGLALRGIQIDRKIRGISGNFPQTSQKLGG